MNIESLMKIQTDLDTPSIKHLINLLKKYRLNMWVYPGVIKRTLAISTRTTYEILEILQIEGYLQSYYELYCSNCQRSSGTAIRYFNDLPDTFECEICHSELPALENAIIIYKVVRE